MILLPVAILAGGLATRIRPLTEKIPKALIHVAGKPFIFHQLDNLKSQGVSRVVICVGYLGEQIIEAVGDGQKWGMQVEYSHDGPFPIGTGGAIQNAIPKLGNNFFVLYGDSYLPVDLPPIQSAFLSANKMGLMTILRNENLWDKSNVILKKGEIIEYNKEFNTSEMKYIDYGLGILTGNSFTRHPIGQRFDLADIYHYLSIKRELLGYEVFSRFYEVGSFDGIKEAERYLLRGVKQ